MGRAGLEGTTGASLATMASPPNGGDAMIGRETRVLLRHYLEQGANKAAIARQVGVSRRTVYRWIASGQLDRGSWMTRRSSTDRGDRARRSSIRTRGSFRLGWPSIRS